MNRRLRRILTILLVLSLVFIMSCKDETASPQNLAFETLTNYLVANDLDITNILTNWIIAAADVVDHESDYYIVDIRSDSIYNVGHIPGAINSTLGDILTTAGNSGGKPILVVCYTGQGAGHGVCALRLSGYPNAKVLKWGMSGWNSDFDSWTGNVGNTAVGNSNWTTDAIVAVEDFDDPELNVDADEEDGAAILAERVDAMLAGGFKGVTNGDVLANPDNYFINNYWAAADVDLYGHIVGAYRINPLTVAGEEIYNLDPDETVVTYCWTGQTSSVITAYLTVLGYDAKSLTFGANSMIYDNLESFKWSSSPDYDYE
ncbi:MAG: hypothetical protein KAT54_04395 [Candidatus Marinimicrobia bacterium]|nr:hypothetical protein [Candidatus Neomarinimicrobiota bacterium]